MEQPEELVSDAHDNAVLDSRIVFRCDGDARIGAGHVARCVVLARELASLGWTPCFVGRYEGFASRLIDAANVTVLGPRDHEPAGIAACAYDAAVIDSYSIPPEAICEVASSLPTVTIAEGNRCPGRGLLIDYHLDVPEGVSQRVLGGPSFALLDPRFVLARRKRGARVDSVLLTLGASVVGLPLIPLVLAFLAGLYPGSEVLVASSVDLEVPVPGNVRRLPPYISLYDIVEAVDLAITAAGHSSYELACAGVPQVAIALTPNQRRVISGLREKDIAPCFDSTTDSFDELRAAMSILRFAPARVAYARRGEQVFDGGGARRAAVALSSRLHGMRRSGRR